MNRWTYGNFPFGWQIPKLGWSFFGTVVYGWSAALLLLFSICLFTDTDLGLATVILPWVGAGVNLILLLWAVLSIPGWRSIDTEGRRVSETRWFVNRKLEIILYFKGTIVHVVLTIIAAIFQGKYTPSYPIDFATDPFLWNLRNYLYLLISVMMLIPLSTMFNTNLSTYWSWRIAGEIASNPSKVRLVGNRM